MSNPSSPFLYERSTLDALHYIQIALRKNLYRVYPTRHLALNPPAQAMRVYANALDIPCIPKGEGRNAIVVYLPDDYEPQLATMAETLSQVYVQTDIGLQSQAAYLSYSAPVRPGQLPMALWLELSELMAAHADNAENFEREGVPVILAAGKKVVVTWFAPDETQLQKYRDALTAAQQCPAGHGVDDIVKARQKAERYGERPWLFMRYELKAGSQRSAVNWAPFGSLEANPTDD